LCLCRSVIFSRYIADATRERERERERVARAELS
jgi:hypothetical protein